MSPRTLLRASRSEWRRTETYGCLAKSCNSAETSMTGSQSIRHPRRLLGARRDDERIKDAVDPEVVRGSVARRAILEDGAAEFADRVDHRVLPDRPLVRQDRGFQLVGAVIGMK